MTIKEKHTQRTEKKTPTDEENENSSRQRKQTESKEDEQTVETKYRL